MRPQPEIARLGNMKVATDESDIKPLRAHHFPNIKKPSNTPVYTDTDISRFRYRLFAACARADAAINVRIKKTVQRVDSIGFCVPCLERHGNEVTATRLIAGEPWCNKCAGGGK